MADINQRLTLADQTLAFTVAWFATTSERGGANTTMMLGVLEEVLPYVTPDHPVVNDQANAARIILNSYRENGRPDLGHAWSQLEARKAAANFTMWRAGRALDDMRTALGEPA